jgi:chromosome segregation ATPase
LQELQRELTDLKQSSKKSIQELKDEVSIYEARCSQLQNSERQATEKARLAADDAARLQRDLRSIESSKAASDNAELMRTKAILESALSEARKSESEARLSLQETSHTYQSKIQHLEREYQIATELAKVTDYISSYICYLHS